MVLKKNKKKIENEKRNVKKKRKICMKKMKKIQKNRHKKWTWQYCQNNVQKDVTLVKIKMWKELS